MRRNAPLACISPSIYPMIFWTVVGTLFLRHDAVHGADLASRKDLRRPVAGVLLGDSTLAIANQSSGTVSLVDLEEESLIGESAIGKELVDIDAIGPERVLVVDHQSHALIVCRIRARINKEDESDIDRLTLIEEQRFTVPAYPIKATVSEDGTWVAATSLWARSLTVGPIETFDNEKQSIKLPFSPRSVLLIEDEKRIVVADAFGGRLAVIRYETEPNSSTSQHLEMGSIREISGNNIRHLMISDEAQGRSLWLSQMNLSRLAAPIQDEVHWGNYASSSIRSLPLDAFLEARRDPSNPGRVMVLGDVRHGSADPGGFVRRTDGRMLVAISGTNEVVAMDRFGNVLDRVAVGTYPTQILAWGDSGYVTINRFDDSLSVIRPSVLDGDYELKSTISLGPMADLSDRDRGEILFHSASLSHDGWMSCHSCHTDGHSCGLSVDTLGDDRIGAAKRILSLRGLKGTEPFAWNGSLNIRDQVRKSVIQTMHGDEIDDDNVSALVAFLESLPSTPARSEVDPQSINIPSLERGKALFKSLDCSGCHARPAMTTKMTYNVGLSDSLGNERFNPPSLRGVRYRSSLLHDGRAKNLQDLFLEHRHPPKVEISEDESRDLIEYLHSL